MQEAMKLALAQGDAEKKKLREFAAELKGQLV